MKFLAVEHALPSMRVTNEDVLDWVRAANRHLAPDETEAICNDLEAFWESCGTRVRYIRAPEEKSIHIALCAGRAALASARVDPGEIDLLIYAGVARGWLEPAVANVMQSELGLRRATNFDVMDACASWLRSVELAESLMRTGRYRTAMIVNCECNCRELADLRFDDVSDLRTRAAGLTVGEAATATIIRRDDVGDDFYCSFRNYSDSYDLCMIPLANASEFASKDLPAGDAPNRFYSDSARLTAAATRHIVELYRSDPLLREGRYDIALGHAASARVGEVVARRLGLPQDTYFDTHSQYGNTVSASVPLAMSLASKAGRLTRGMNCLVVIGSAGISVGLARFVY